MRLSDQVPDPPVPGEAVERPWVLLVDDGELDDLKEIVEELGATAQRSPREAHERRGWRQPQRLLLVSDRRAPTLRRPVAQEQDDFVTAVVLDQRSRTLRHHVARMGFDYVLERPIDPTALRSLVREALFRGHEQRWHDRLPVWWPVVLRAGWRSWSARLIELTHKGCSLEVEANLGGQRRVHVEIPRYVAGGAEPLRVRGHVYRERASSRDGVRILSVLFRPDAVCRRRVAAVLDALHNRPPVLGRRGRTLARPDPE
jgi:hypothetical protein